MPLNLANYKTKAKAAVKRFWAGRAAARDKQTTSGKLERYHLLCKRLMQEQFYTAATVIASPRDSSKTGKFSTHDDPTSLTQFVATFAGHIAAVAASTSSTSHP